MRPLQRIGYDLGQTARVLWFIGQYVQAQRRSLPVLRRIDWPKNMPDRRLILEDLRALFLRDRANVEAGLYKVPHDLVPNPLGVLRKSRRFFQDLDAVNERRLRAGHQEIAGEAAAADPSLPRYYRQNFHFQSGGWLTEESARLYDYQVDVLFAGGADAMRRQALVPLHHFLAARPPRPSARLLDIATGTGKFLTFVLQSFPRLQVTAVDLSPPYLAEAERRTARFGKVRFEKAAAEALPFKDGSFEVLTCVFLFHELPRKVRRQAAAEFTRVLAPGGRLILVDSIQKGDHPPFDTLLDAFPLTHHEPYFADYARDDLDSLFAEAGLQPAGQERAHLSKVAVYDKSSL